MKKNSFTMKDVKESLDLMVEQNYLKKTKKGYKDSDYVTKLLKQGKTRSQIAKILENDRRGKR